MRTLIYQYWIGNLEQCAREGKRMMEAYAKKIGSEYRFDLNPTWASYLGSHCASHMSALRPVFDATFHKYDKVMYIDCDIFPVDGLNENIFECETGEMVVCEELHQPKMRKEGGKSQDEKWAKRVKQLYGKTMPRTKDGLLRVFNSGLVIYSKQGMEKAINTFIPMKEFIGEFRPHFKRPLYYRDQAYVHAMLEVGEMDWRTLSTNWNSQVHWKPQTKPNAKGTRPVIDCRTKDTKFVHVQLTGSSNWGRNKLWQVVNLPPSEWKLK